jgi:hypothetical protein
MADLELDGIERMYADALFDAADRATDGETTWITQGGIRVAVIMPPDHEPGYRAELRTEYAVRCRQLDRVRTDYRTLTDEVLTALTTHEHEMTMWGGLPFCRCGLSLGDGDAQGMMITHVLGLAKPPLITEHASRTEADHG